MTTVTDAQERLTNDEVAEIIGISPKTMRNWTVYGIGPEPVRTRRGRANRLYWVRSDVEAWIRENLTDENAKTVS
jgi:phage terminase Nu1 subunit (DNA packaging protein)